MATSTLKYVAKYQDVTADDPVDTLTVRSAINNANHLADSIAQTIFAYSAHSSTFNSNPLAGDTSGTAWKKFVIGSHPVTLKSNGTPYLFRIRMVATKSGSSGSPAIGISFGGPPAKSPEETSSTITATTFTDASVADTSMTLDTNLTVSADSLVYGTYVVPQTFGGADVTQKWATVPIVVWSKRDTTNVDIDSIYVAEYIGT